LSGAGRRVSVCRRDDRAGRYEAKYGPDWHFDVDNGAFNGQEGNVALVFAVAPASAFGFGKGNVFSQTRWQFQEKI